ncbi:glycoside hydrolase family 38 C-terminal domain-containing protein [Agrobacterium vitis]|uniref:alpha-mannosidase n=1 Tax=Agrobacterium vitis TaxID=373 RepID=UPI0012E79B57|nr:glycoside hydrolase family 38 C-terminal domain-containing protein [Agrobacterium vitis]MVA51240.1 alpha-mannosidase [Agrobacterium vitis]NSZ55794.1 alpha-mannosidase [Agrobacterium vitis]NTA35045.1 alpha-mannosidase [Agrobacterium vitis]
MRAYRDRQRSLEQLSRHIEVWADELEAYELRERMPLGAFLASTPEGLTRHMGVGDAWPNRHGIHTFLLEDAIMIPEEPGVELRLDFGGESLVRLIGLDGEILESFAANPCHRRFDVPRGIPFKIKAESAARSLFGVPNRNPVLSMAEIYAYYPEIRALRRRLLILRNTADTVKDKELARTLYEAAEIVLSGLRLPTATQDVGPRLASRTWARDIWERSFEPTDTPNALTQEALASVETATVRLDAMLTELRNTYPKQGRVLVTGHAHIDYAWLWPQPETVRKIVRTFNSVNALLKRHDDFRFLQSSSLYYQHVEQEDPALFEEIKQRVSEGRWEVIGGMLVECDTNMPSAEAFLRQFLHGQRYFQKHFGVTSRTAWLPDTFGFTAAMPQIMRHAGIDTLVTIKVSWNETNSLPDNLFRWQGNDGSRVLVHTFDAYDNDGYNMLMTPAALCEVWGKHAAKDMTDTVIASYGWGDGGGGPDPDQIETLPLLNLMPAIPTVEHGAIEPHIQALASYLEAAALPVWRGELYLEYHRATLTTQARTKQLNRQAEAALVAAEAICVLDALEGGAPAANNLEPQWELLLRNQFHDILPGSSIREVYQQTEPELEGVIDDVTTLIQTRLQAIAARHSGDLEGLLVANLSGSRKTAFQIESASALPAALQAQELNGRYVAAIERDLKPLSLGFVSSSSQRRVTTDGKTMENDFVRLMLDEAGRMISLIDKRSNRELMDGPGNQLLLYRNDLPRNFDAWDIEPGFELGEEEWLSLEKRDVTANGPHLAEITITRRFSASTIQQKIRLWSNSPRVEFVTDLDWHDRRTYLRAAFPVNVLAEDAVFDQAIGITRRPTHDNTSWQKAQFESCGHRFVSLSETDWGAALLSADKYGFSAKGNRLTLSLVRGPMFPDMLADEGHHHFVYALLPHDGRWWSEEVQAEADLVNAGRYFTPATATENYDIAPIGLSGQNVRLHALKPAEKGEGHVLRLSESAGRRGVFHLALPGGCKPTLINAIEVPLDDLDDPLSRPFGLASFLF